MLLSKYHCGKSPGDVGVGVGVDAGVSVGAVVAGGAADLIASSLPINILADVTIASSDESALLITDCTVAMVLWISLIWSADSGYCCRTAFAAASTLLA